MKLLFVVLFVVVIVAQVHCSLAVLRRPGIIFRSDVSDALCVAANTLKQAGWMNSDGTWSRKMEESNEAKECRDLVGDNPCDTADKILSCMTHKGLTTAVHIATLPVGGMSP